MNSHKVKTINFIKRLRRYVKKTNLPAASLSIVEPRINQLYLIDFPFNGVIQKDVLARYVGLSKTCHCMNFELYSFFTREGVKVHLVCLDKLPTKITLCTNSLFNYVATPAA
ncbi:MAG TPA: hypothetical protein VK796_00605 [Cytophaga sp.]|jgi:hypothetical protein|nr:hypothetical protein [Cytophaga sp.]